MRVARVRCGGHLAAQAEVRAGATAHGERSLVLLKSAGPDAYIAPPLSWKSAWQRASLPKLNVHV